MFSVRLLLLVMLGASATCAGAETLSDPTRPWAYQAPPSRMSGTPRAPLLTSVMIAPDRRVAVIAGQVVREGERVGNLQVIAIEPDRVRVRGPRGYSTLKLLRAPVKRAAGKASE